MNTVDRDTFIQKNMGLVGMVVNKHAYRVAEHTYIDREDLVNIGAIGLIKAYDRFDDSYGVQFSTYAIPMIAGEIKRYLRDNLDSVRFSRQSKTDFYAISSAHLLNENPELISDILDIPINRVENALDYYRCKFVDSLDRELHDDEGNSTALADTVGAEVDFDSNLEIELLLNKIDKMKGLNKRTRKIVELRLQDLSQTEIGKIMGISQAQISRIFIKLRKQLKGGNEMSENKLVEKKVIEKQEAKVNKKQVVEKKSPDYVLAKKLAGETDLSPAKIREKTRVSYTTVYNYIQEYRVVEEEKETLKEISVESVEVAPVAMEKYRLDIPEEVINKPKTEPADGFMTMTFKLTVEDATNQLEDIIKAIGVLGFKDLNLTIQSQQVA